MVQYKNFESINVGYIVLRIVLYVIGTYINAAYIHE